MSETEVLQLDLADEAALQRCARRMAPSLSEGAVIFLSGELGAGKTTFARALLQQLGVNARIKSPTYSLIESYAVPGMAIHHLDLYRIADAGELEWLGLADLATDRANLLLVEWPERGAGHLPVPDLVLQLDHSSPGRRLALRPNGRLGEALLANLQKAWDAST